MNFFKDMFQTLRWLLAVMRAFMRVRPATTISVVVLSVTSRITGLLATFLPLKVIILVGSDGIPSYFRLFLDTDDADKTTWIIIFAALAVSAYFITQLIDTIAAWLSEKASMDVLSGANQMAVASSIRNEAQTYYSRFADVCTSWLFGLLGLAVLPLVNMTVFLVVAAAMLVELLFTALVIEHTDPHRPNRLRRMITQGLGGYLEMLGTFNFLAGFLTILATYVFGEPGNILIAILAIILMRRCFSSLGSGIRQAASLARRRAVINPLVFRSHTAKPRNDAVTRTLRELFSKSYREQRTADELRKALGKEYNVAVRWTDSRINNVSIFKVEATDTNSDDVMHFQQQVYSAKQLQLLEKEEFLFSIVSRESLNAAQIVSRFTEGPFTCQICEYGRGTPLPADKWSEMLVAMTVDQWGYKPPQKLVSAFRTAKSFLSGRLQADFVKRISVAIDFPEEREIYESLLHALPDIGKTLDRVPLYVFNPDFARANTAWNEDGSASLMFWGRWSIAPFGAKLENFNNDQLVEMLREVSRRRDDVPPDLAPAHLKFVGMCYELERSINKEEYKAALKTAQRLLASPVLKAARSGLEA